MQESDFKNRLNQFLFDSGMSKNSLAKKLKISQSQVSNWSNVGVKRWTKNTKIINDFMDEHYQDNFKIPTKIEKTLKQILLKNSENEVHILMILNAVNSLKLEGNNE
ncbi:hypothetical protein CRYPA_948 [uncultured Candidatus Thioglobus sp.]|nr:hypothetical protein CRYPA_948 [uncultured Candidatus Thioglobus sp.]